MQSISIRRADSIDSDISEVDENDEKRADDKSLYASNKSEHLTVKVEPISQDYESDSDNEVTKEVTEQIVCSFCSHVSMSSYEFYVHVVEKHKQYPCGICLVYFKSSVLLTFHEILRHECRVCKKEIENAEEKVEHMTSIHKKMVLTCSKCEFSALDDEEVVDHYELMHGKINIENEINCFICGKVSPNKMFHQLHMDSKHKDIKLADMDETGLERDTNRRKTKEKFKQVMSAKWCCQFCKKIFDSIDTLESHDEKLHQCKFCDDEPSMSSEDRNFHMKKYHPKAFFSCTKCDFLALMAEDIAEHMILHISQPSIPPKSQQSKRKAISIESNLSYENKKRRIEEIQCDFWCDSCETDFQDEEEYEAHLSEVHRCRLCQQNFENSKLRSKHMKENHPSAFFSCTRCDFIALSVQEIAKHKHEDEPESASKLSNDEIITKRKKSTNIQKPVQMKKILKPTQKANMVVKPENAYELMPPLKPKQKSKPMPETMEYQPDPFQRSPSPDDDITDEVKWGEELNWGTGPETITNKEPKIQTPVINQCTYCQQSVPGNMKVHHLVVHQCRLCNYLFNNAGEKSKHMRMTHPNSLISCTKCKFVALSEMVVISHFEDTHLPEYTKDYRLDPLKAALCVVTTDQTDDHNMSDLHQQIIEDADTPYYQTNVTSFVCRICKIEMMNLKSLEKHMKDEHENFPICDHFPINVTNKSWRTHMRKEHNAKFWTCLVCMKDFFVRDSLRRHIICKHKAHPSVVCNVCKEPLLNAKDQFKHQHSHDQVECEQCGERFKNNTVLVAHTMAVHMGVGGKEFCHDCGKTFPSTKSLSRHRKICKEKVKHDQQSTVKPPPKRKSAPKRKPTEKPTKPCDECDQLFKNEKVLASHYMHAHLNMGTEFYCRECGKQCSSKIDLKRHLNSHGIDVNDPREAKAQGVGENIVEDEPDEYDDNEEEDYEDEDEDEEGEEGMEDEMEESRKQSKGSSEVVVKCEPQEYHFETATEQGKNKPSKHLDVKSELLTPEVKIKEENVNSKAYKNLMSYFQDESIMKCKTCQEVFAGYNALQQHMNDAHDSRQPICAHDRSEFTTKNDWVQHLKGEHGAELYPCPACDTEFNEKDLLRTHIIRKHPDDPDVMCKVCKKPMPTMKERYFHSKNHGDQTTCEQCGEKFNSAKVLASHTMVAHMNTGSNAFCFKCGDLFKDALKLNAHHCK